MDNISNQTVSFIRAHQDDDVRGLALRFHNLEGVDMAFALQQIDGRQRARRKLPSWAEHDGIVYPPHLSMEQCSGEAAALYKLRLARGRRMADLTGGFGVDFSYLSGNFEQAVYVERQPLLCDLARHNFEVLGLENATVVCSDAEKFLDEIEENWLDGSFDLIYLDPARRDANGHKTFAIEDCTPDVSALMPRLLRVARRVVVKLSPMLDHNAAARALGGVTEIHIISTRNECKETLFVIDSDFFGVSAENEPFLPAAPAVANGNAAEGVRLFCVNDGEVFQTQAFSADPVPVASEADMESLRFGCGGATADAVLYVPNASVMKAGCFAALCREFGLVALEHNSHLFLKKNAHFIDNFLHSETDAEDSRFPGRRFRIKSFCSLNRNELKAALAGIDHANISTRNFPLTPEALRKKLSKVTPLRDGGDTFIFATTAGGRHQLLITERL